LGHGGPKRKSQAFRAHPLGDRHGRHAARYGNPDRLEHLEPSSRFEFIFNTGQMDGLPAVYYGSAEVVTLKTLGATRRRLAWIFTVEFLAMGSVAGLMGSLLAAAFSGLVLKRLLDIDFRPDIPAHLLTVPVSALLAAAAGWAASFRTLGRKPLEILREE
jgi:cytochrome bd-type quinol oxidase subunit 1